MNFNEFLKKSSEETNSIACMGLDPEMHRIEAAKGDFLEVREKHLPQPSEGIDLSLPPADLLRRLQEIDREMGGKIINFYSSIIDACISEKVLPSAFKPNYAFYAKHGFEGLKALEKVIEKCRKINAPIIFDGKRGDIGKTSEAYVMEAFSFWKADALTVNPFMGEDSVKPFIDFCERHKRFGVYVLNRTSNSGAKDFQNLKVNGKELFLLVSEKIVEWGKNAQGSVGAVVGATSLHELEKIAKFFVESKQEVPLLIPGVGSQGGSAKEVVNVLKKVGYDLRIVRINSSSALNYAFETDFTIPPKNFSLASVKALKKLNEEIGFKRNVFK